MSPRELVTWRGHSGRELSGRLAGARAAGAERAPGVLLVHLEPSLGPTVEMLTRRLVAAGFVVLVPCPGLDATAETDRSLLADHEAGLVLLQGRADLDPERLAVIGLCRGGTLAFQLACTSRRVAAAVDLAGPVLHAELCAARPIQPLELALNLSSPLLALFGAEDTATPAGQIARLRAALAQSMKTFELEALEGAGPGFLDPTASGYHPRLAAAAGERSVRFLSELLQLS